MALKEYQSKRNFKKTPEPSGSVPQQQNQLTFVVHKHDATRLHYDLRLELDGVLHSWAVPKGFSLNPLDRHLAVQVEDHPLEYGNFEGVIPKGNYGAGPVMIWDRGTYAEHHSETFEESYQKLVKGLAKGQITVTFRGTKLKGDFTLVRSGKDDKAWFLIKKRDGYAQFGTKTVFSERSVVSQRTMEEIRSGAAPSKQPVKEGEIDDESLLALGYSAMRARQSSKNWSLPLSVTFRNELDGYRVLAVRAGDAVKLLSGWGREYGDKFKEIAQQLLKIEGSWVLDGEIVSSDRGHGKKLEEEGDVHAFHIYDVLVWDRKEVANEPLSKRLDVLQKIKIPRQKNNRLHKAAYFEKDMETHLQKALKAGYTGLVVIDKESPYEPGLSNSACGIDSTGELKALLAQPAPEKKKTPEASILTHGSRMYWPEEKITKGDVFAYYEQIADIILPYLENRPLSLRRHPGGALTSSFFQKDLTGYIPGWMKTFAHQSRSSDKTILYPLCQNKKSLLYLVNLGCIEFNPWISRISSPEVPDYAAIDLDPHERPWSDVVKVAKFIHAVCAANDVPHVVKTSGSSGIHILVPLKGPWSYDESRHLCERICDLAHQEFSKITSMERNPSQRVGKMYLDCLQNRRSQTLAAAYCVRPKASATVSTPVEWEELNAKLDPREFNLRTIPARLSQKSDIWRGKWHNGLDRSEGVDKPINSP
ncbi:MAG: DNA polymerase ligase N-terminal domain-containing protein [Oligoflexales bacterium]